MLTIREAHAQDVSAVRDIFVAVYGTGYPHPEFYDTDWLTKFVYDDDSIFLVAEDEGRIVASASVLLAVGDADDMLALVGRFVVHPSVQGRGLGGELDRERLLRLQDRVHVVFGEVRAGSRANQKLKESLGFAPVGVQPLAYRFTERETDIIFVRLSGPARVLRRNNPRLIPEAARLANLVLPWLNLPADAIVDDSPDGYPTDPIGLDFDALVLEDAAEVRHVARTAGRAREIFGRITLAVGFFQLARAHAQYIVARPADGGAIVGAVGFTFDERDERLRILDLTARTDAVAGALLAHVTHVVAPRFAAVYMDVDVSAYAPRIQRTLARLGYVPVVYFPAMVFEEVERLDVVRMAKLGIPCDLGPLQMLQRPDSVRQVVEESFERCGVSNAVALATRGLSLFDGLDEADRAELARLARSRRYGKGDVIVRYGGPPDRVLVLAEGEAQVRAPAGRRAAVVPGQLFGEMALAERAPRSADVVAVAACATFEFDVAALDRLFERRPRLGVLVMRNLGRALGEKLREP